MDRDQLDEDGKRTGEREVIFPRYHQLDSVRRLVAHARQHGTGQNYLIEHSAGSGKSNPIAWLCHRLVGLADAQNRRVFDSIVVVTDRRVLDQQLRNTIRSFETVKGTVVAIEKHKAQELAEALTAAKDIIITTLQTFPFVTVKIGQLARSRFAVVIDEAHSSQSGETNRKMKETLAARNLKEAAEEEGVEVRDSEDDVNAAVEEAMRRRGRLKNVSFFAFTATPKAKTLELFGRQQADGTRGAFSLYSMRQAIDEDFILDALQNYITFKVYFSLLKKVESDPRYDRKKGTYFEATLLTEPTDPNKLYDLKRTVEDHHLFDSNEVDDFARVYFSAKGKQAQLQPLLDSVADRYALRSKEERTDIRKHIGDYVRLYAFLSQVITFSDAKLEKFYQFTRHLLRKLKLPDDPLPVEITRNINMDSYRIQQTSSGTIKLMSEDGELKPISALGTGRPQQENLEPLSQIIEYINEHFGTNFTSADKVKFFAENMGRRLEGQEGLRRALDTAVNPSEETRKLAFDTFFSETLEDMIDSDFDIYKKIKDETNFGALFRAVMYRRIAASLQAQLKEFESAE